MPYSDLIRQEDEYTYSAVLQFDIMSDKKMLRFIPSAATVAILRDYFVDMTREKPEHHARIMYGSYGTGKSHLLTVLGQLLGKQFMDGVAYNTFLQRLRNYDPELAADIESYKNTPSRKPALVVPIVYDFEDFDRCIFFSLRKKLESLNISVNFASFYEQAQELLDLWKSDNESKARLAQVTKNASIQLPKLEEQLQSHDIKAQEEFQLLFSQMTYGATYVHESTNLIAALQQVRAAISDDYSGIVFIFDEFGQYMESNLKSIKVAAIQNLAEYCDHNGGNDHIILVSHREIGQYTEGHGKNVATEWKKVEGRYQASSMSGAQDQCLSLVKAVLTKVEPVWTAFKNHYSQQLNAIYGQSMSIRKALAAGSDVGENPFEDTFPLHPIALLALDRLSKKVAQNGRTFFTFLASKDNRSLYSVLTGYELDEFHFVGLDAIYDYFQTSISAKQSEAAYKWHHNLMSALNKNGSDVYDSTPEVRILKSIAVIGVVDDSSILAANDKTLLAAIDCPTDKLTAALQALCAKKILKYSGTYDRYEFFDASIFDVDSIIEEESQRVSDDALIKVLNAEFTTSVLYPRAYNRDRRMSRVFAPVFATLESIDKPSFAGQFGPYYDGLLIMLLSDPDDDQGLIARHSADIPRNITFVKLNCSELREAGRKYVAAKYLDTQKAEYIQQDPVFDKELQYHIQELASIIDFYIKQWLSFCDGDYYVLSCGEPNNEVSSISQMEDLASTLMRETYRDTLIVNNELINKNVVSGTITAAKKNAIRGMLQGRASQNYFDLPELSPDYIAVRSVLVKNGFIVADNAGAENVLPDGQRPQDAVRTELERTIAKARRDNISFAEVYHRLKMPPYGLRDGYLSLLFAYFLTPYQKTLVITSHGTEQEITPELFEEIVRRPEDYTFILANWSSEQVEFIDAIEELYAQYINPVLRSKNRLKAIYEGMLTHYRKVSKFARTTERYISDLGKAYRRVMEGHYTSYSKFFLTELHGMTGDYTSALSAVRQSVEELDSAADLLAANVRAQIQYALDLSSDEGLSEQLQKKYRDEWKAKRKKSFDYYANSFLEYVSHLRAGTADSEIAAQLARVLTGMELLYWSDQNEEEFAQRLIETARKINSYQANGDLNDGEARVSLVDARGEERALVFNQDSLSELARVAKNKINADLAHYGLSLTFDDKVNVLLSLLGDLMEGAN